MPPGLLLMLALDIRFAANSFSIGYLRRLQGNLYTKSLSQASHDGFYMQLPHSRDEHFVGLLVAAKSKSWILLQNLVQRTADLVLIPPRLWLNRKGNQRLWKREVCV